MPEKELQLHRWWQRDVKFDGYGLKRSTLGQLLSLLPAGIKPCWSDPVLEASSLVSVKCSPGKGGVGSVGAAFFLRETSSKTSSKVVRVV